MEEKKSEKLLPILTSEEFRYIRCSAGITLKQFAEEAGKCSRSTTSNWERNQEIMVPFQIMLLKNMMPPEVWNTARMLYENLQAEKEAKKKKRKRKENII